MHGGKILWLIDGVRISKENLSISGMSPAMELDLNLNDQLFRYGVRINPVLLQDVQCVSVPMNIAPPGTPPKFDPSPWFYAPLLLASPQHPVTRNITEVKADFCSNIDIVGENKKVKTELLLATSDNTHIVSTPTTVDLNNMPKANDKGVFNLGYIPVAVSSEGVFQSVYANRMTPTNLTNTSPILPQSVVTRQIIVADGDIIRNETNGIPSDSTTLPLGFDRYMNQQFGNKDFVLNSVLYLTDNQGWMQLRNRTLKLRLLNKEVAGNEKLKWQIFNVLMPICLLLLVGVIYTLMRKRKYTRPMKE
jgi:ABC-2 type transport system permease protein